jgi:hypothetical protein
MMVMVMMIAVRLMQGDHSNGILQVIIKTTYSEYFRTVCGTGFDDNDAQVACRDLGYQHGRALPPGKYDRFHIKG